MNSRITSAECAFPVKDIRYPGDHDVMLGRGGESNNHAGNVKFRALVMRHKEAYIRAPRQEKTGVAWDVVLEWRSMSPPGRFLTRTNPMEGASLWYDVGDEQARRRTSKTLGEKLNKRHAPNEITSCSEAFLGQAAKRARLMSLDYKPIPVRLESAAAHGRRDSQWECHADILEMEKHLSQDSTSEVSGVVTFDESEISSSNISLVSQEDDDSGAEEDCRRGHETLSGDLGAIGRRLPTAAELASCFDFC